MHHISCKVLYFLVMFFLYNFNAPISTTIKKKKKNSWRSDFYSWYFFFFEGGFLKSGELVSPFGCWGSVLFILHQVRFLCQLCSSVPWQKPIKQNNKALYWQQALFSYQKLHFDQTVLWNLSTLMIYSELKRHLCTGAMSNHPFPKAGIVDFLLDVVNPCTFACP